MASRESTVGAVCYLGFQSTVEIHHEYTCHSVRYVLFLHIVNLVNLVNLRTYLWKNKNLGKTATCRFFQQMGRPEARTRQTTSASAAPAAGSTLTMEVDADVRELRRRVQNWPFRWMKTSHPDDEEAIRDGPKHAEQKEGPQIGGANMVCLRFHVNKYIKYRLDSFYINISMQFM